MKADLHELMDVAYDRGVVELRRGPEDWDWD